MKQEIQVYINGMMKSIGQDQLKKLSPGFLNGFGVFETLLCEKQKVYFLDEHIRRFVYGCDRYILPRPPALSDIKKILANLVKLNKVDNARVRLAAWRKSYDVHFSALMIPREAFSENSYREGFAACLYTRVLDRSPELAKIKSLDYSFYLAAYEFALANHCHEAILLNSSGVIVEGSRSNIFLVKNNKLFTPSLASGCLAGVVRQAVLAAAKRSGIKTAQDELSILDLHKCDEAFLTNSLIGIMPLTFLANHKIGTGRPGPATIRLMKAYKKLSQEYSDSLV